MNLALAFSLSVAIVYWLTRKQKPYSTSEWVQRMKDLGIGCK